MSSAHANSSGKDPTDKEVRALMKVLIGVHPHKTSVAVAAVDEATGELLERASFPQNRAGSRALERWAKRFPERRPKRWRTPAVSVGILQARSDARGGAYYHKKIAEGKSRKEAWRCL
jgi:hypothetical protein